MKVSTSLLTRLYMVVLIIAGFCQLPDGAYAQTMQGNSRIQSGPVKLEGANATGVLKGRMRLAELLSPDFIKAVSEIGVKARKISSSRNAKLTVKLKLGNEIVLEIDAGDEIGVPVSTTQADQTCCGKISIPGFVNAQCTAMNGVVDKDKLSHLLKCFKEKISASAVNVYMPAPGVTNTNIVTESSLTGVQYYIATSSKEEVVLDTSSPTEQEKLLRYVRDNDSLNVNLELTGENVEVGDINVPALTGLSTIFIRDPTALNTSVTQLTDQLLFIFVIRKPVINKAYWLDYLYGRWETWSKQNSNKLFRFDNVKTFLDQFPFKTSVEKIYYPYLDIDDKKVDDLKAIYKGLLPMITTYRILNQSDIDKWDKDISNHPLTKGDRIVFFVPSKKSVTAKVVPKIEHLPAVWLANFTGEANYWVSPSIEPGELKPKIMFDPLVHGVSRPLKLPTYVNSEGGVLKDDDESFTELIRSLKLKQDIFETNWTYITLSDNSQSSNEVAEAMFPITKDLTFEQANELRRQFLTRYADKMQTVSGYALVYDAQKNIDKPEAGAAGDYIAEPQETPWVKSKPLKPKPTTQSAEPTTQRNSQREGVAMEILSHWRHSGNVPDIKLDGKIESKEWAVFRTRDVISKKFVPYGTGNQAMYRYMFNTDPDEYIYLRNEDVSISSDEYVEYFDRNWKRKQPDIQANPSDPLREFEVSYLFPEVSESRLFKSENTAWKYVSKSEGEIPVINWMVDAYRYEFGSTLNEAKSGDAASFKEKFGIRPNISFDYRSRTAYDGYQLLDQKTSEAHPWGAKGNSYGIALDEQGYDIEGPQKSNAKLTLDAENGEKIILKLPLVVRSELKNDITGRRNLGFYNRIRGDHWPAVGSKPTYVIDGLNNLPHYAIPQLKLSYISPPELFSTVNPLLTEFLHFIRQYDLVREDVVDYVYEYRHTNFLGVINIQTGSVMHKLNQNTKDFQTFCLTKMNPEIYEQKIEFYRAMYLALLIKHVSKFGLPIKLAPGGWGTSSITNYLGIDHVKYNEIWNNNPWEYFDPEKLFKDEVDVDNADNDKRDDFVSLLKLIYEKKPASPDPSSAEFLTPAKVPVAGFDMMPVGLRFFNLASGDVRAKQTVNLNNELLGNKKSVDIWWPYPAAIAANVGGVPIHAERLFGVTTSTGYSLLDFNSDGKLIADDGPGAGAFTYLDQFRTPGDAKNWKEQAKALADLKSNYLSAQKAPKYEDLVDLRFMKEYTFATGNDNIKGPVTVRLLDPDPNTVSHPIPEKEYYMSKQLVAKRISKENFAGRVTLAIYSISKGELTYLKKVSGNEMSVNSITSKAETGELTKTIDESGTLFDISSVIKGLAANSYAFVFEYDGPGDGTRNDENRFQTLAPFEDPASSEDKPHGPQLWIKINLVDYGNKEKYPQIPVLKDNWYLLGKQALSNKSYTINNDDMLNQAKLVTSGFKTFFDIFKPKFDTEIADMIFNNNNDVAEESWRANFPLNWKKYYHPDFLNINNEKGVPEEVSSDLKKGFKAFQKDLDYGVVFDAVSLYRPFMQKDGLDYATISPLGRIINRPLTNDELTDYNLDKKMDWFTAVVTDVYTAYKLSDDQFFKNPYGVNRFAASNNFSDMYKWTMHFTISDEYGSKYRHTSLLYSVPGNEFEGGATIEEQVGVQLDVPVPEPVVKAFKEKLGKQQWDSAIAMMPIFVRHFTLEKGQSPFFIDKSVQLPDIYHSWYWLFGPKRDAMVSMLKDLFSKETSLYNDKENKLKRHLGHAKNEPWQIRIPWNAWTWNEGMRFRTNIKAVYDLDRFFSSEDGVFSGNSVMRKLEAPEFENVVLGIYLDSEKDWLQSYLELFVTRRRIIYSKQILLDSKQMLLEVPLRKVPFMDAAVEVATNSLNKLRLVPLKERDTRLVIQKPPNGYFKGYNLKKNEFYYIYQDGQKPTRKTTFMGILCNGYLPKVAENDPYVRESYDNVGAYSYQSSLSLPIAWLPAKDVYLPKDPIGMPKDPPHNFQATSNTWNDEMQSKTGERVDSASRRMIAVYPNPTSAILFVKYGSRQATKIGISIAGLDGKIYARQESAVSKGDMTIALDVSRLAAGTYIVQLVDAEGTLSSKFIKL